MGKLKRAGVEPYWTETEKDSKGNDRVIAAKYKLEFRQISILSNKKRKGNQSPAFLKVNQNHKDQSL
jgi:hypothetical protein